MTAKKNKHHRIKLWSIRFPVLNDIERIFKQLQTCETFEPCDVVERLGHFDGIASSLACIPTKQHGVRGGKYLLNTPGDAISEILNFTMSLDASALKNVRLWCEFQSHLLFIISLLLKNVLTALDGHLRELSVSHNCLLNEWWLYLNSKGPFLYLWGCWGHPHAWKNLTTVIKVQKMSASKYFCT